MNKMIPLPTKSPFVKRIFTYVSQEHYEQLSRDQKTSNCPSLSQYFRLILSGQESKIIYRDLQEEKALFLMNKLSQQMDELTNMLIEKAQVNWPVDKSYIALINEMRNLFGENKEILKKLLTIWSLKYTLVKTSTKR